MRGSFIAMVAVDRKFSAYDPVSRAGTVVMHKTERMNEMRGWQLDRDGFVMNYMLAGPDIRDYETGTRLPNQLELEGALRREIVTPKQPEMQESVKLGKEARNGQKWQTWYSHGNCFIDVSAFYSTLQKVTLEAATVLCVPEDMTVQAVIWTYMSVGLYCNGVLVGEQETPIYKPIRRSQVSLPLKKGRNLIYLSCENLGVRDTRNMVGLQLLERREEITVSLPDETIQDTVETLTSFLDQIRAEGDEVSFGFPAPEGTEALFPRETTDFTETQKQPEWEDISGQQSVKVPAEYKKVRIRTSLRTIQLERMVEFADRYQPKYVSKPVSGDGSFRQILETIAAVNSENRGEFGFGMSNVLARKYLGTERPSDRDLILDTLRLIDLRVDCADFILCGLLRYMHNYEMDEELLAKTKEVLLRFRYWMTMDGADAMCFWSENHSLMFYACAMDVGQLYPEDWFVRAGMTGAELHEYGKKKVLDWLSDVETWGFEEFLSSVYMCVTFGALLNVIDYSDEEISRRAAAVTDLLLEQLCLQTFRGTEITPMGRVYRGVIYPFAEGAQSMIDLVDSSAPFVSGEGWLAFLATSRYRLPDGLAEKMRGNIRTSYTTGNATIVLEKNEDYCLTSVRSLGESPHNRWENVIVRDKKNPDNKKADTDTHEYNKSLNECFHGTTDCAPGVYGYQQHLWTAALDGEAVLFVNHPGSSSENTGLRPGYWYGNGVMPALRQEKGILGAIYRIGEEHPIHFTHVYCPYRRFDEARMDGQWLFLCKGEGYLALWCSGQMEPYDDWIFGCELRVYGSDAAYLCVCGSGKENGSFEAFMEYAKALAPTFDRSEGMLLAGNFSLTYQFYQDETQYVL